MVEEKWLEEDTLYLVLSESEIPVVLGGYKGLPILQIVENSNNMGTIYT